MRLRGDDVVALPRSDCRWKSERRLKKALRRADCDFVVDTRIQAAVDGGVRLHDADIDRTHWLARVCQVDDRSLFFLSSARVFSGESERAYSEEDYPDSSESVGELLLAAEGAVRDKCEQHLILRLGPVFGATGANTMTRILEGLREGEPLTLGNRERGAPVSARDAARVVSGLLDQFSTGIDNWGIYHYCSAEPTSCFEFAEVLLASASQYAQLDNDAVSLARTEGDSTLSRVLDCSRIRDNFAIKQVAWRQCVPALVREYFA